MTRLTYDQVPPRIDAEWRVFYESECLRLEGALEAAEAERDAAVKKADDLEVTLALERDAAREEIARLAPFEARVARITEPE